MVGKIQNNETFEALPAKKKLKVHRRTASIRQKIMIRIIEQMVKMEKTIKE